MEQKSKNGVSIIGGADGPTSIFIAGPSEKQPLKVRIKNGIYRYKRIKVEKTIVANPHSLSETVQYAKDLEEDLKNAIPDRVFITHSECCLLYTSGKPVCYLYFTGDFYGIYLYENPEDLGPDNYSFSE